MWLLAKTVNVTFKCFCKKNMYQAFIFKMEGDSARA
jgi:hypothetical protein